MVGPKYLARCNKNAVKKANKMDWNQDNNLKMTN
jgi:hypothetical protein